MKCSVKQPVFHGGICSPEACLFPPWCWICLCSLFVIQASTPFFIMCCLVLKCIFHLFFLLEYNGSPQPHFFLLPDGPVLLCLYEKSLDSPASVAVAPDAPLWAVVPSPHHLGVQPTAPSLCGAEHLSSMLNF